MKRFLITFEQPVIHSITIEAASMEHAQDIAEERYQSDDGLGDYHAPKNWNVTWGAWEIITCEEVQP